MRYQFKKHIIDSSGYVITPKGNMLHNYYRPDGKIAVEIKGKEYLLEDIISGYEEPSYKNIKFLKSLNKWRTTVIIDGKSCPDNDRFHTPEEAAEHVNRIYDKYKLDRLYNAVPAPTKRQARILNKEPYMVFLSGSMTIGKLPVEAILELDKLKGIPNVRFLIGDAKGADRHFQKACEGESVLICHMQARPRNKVFAESFTHRVEVPEGKRVTGRQYMAIKDEFMSEQCHHALIVCKHKSKGSMDNYDRILKDHKPVKLIEVD